MNESLYEEVSKSLSGYRYYVQTIDSACGGLLRDSDSSIHATVIEGYFDVIAKLWPNRLPLWRYIKWAWSLVRKSFQADFREWSDR